MQYQDNSLGVESFPPHLRDYSALVEHINFYLKVNHQVKKVIDLLAL